MFTTLADTLANPPPKQLLRIQKSFWGDYLWPYEGYRRFEDRAALEEAADETFKMKTAFSFLTGVRELALSLDNGLGWLNGPDLSVRARVLRRPPAVFGTRRNIPTRQSQVQEALWKWITSTHESQEDLLHLGLCVEEFDDPGPAGHGDSAAKNRWSHLEAIPGSMGRGSWLQGDARLMVDTWNEYGATQSRATVRAVPSLAAAIGTACQSKEHSPGRPFGRRFARSGVLYTRSLTSNDDPTVSRFPLAPMDLTQSQREWLLETDWAQRAFVLSYVLAVMDQPRTFVNVHTLKLCRIPSRYLSTLCRHDFWDSLSGLSKVEICAIPEWTSVTKDAAGFVTSAMAYPSRALVQFKTLLTEIIALKRNITHLSVGWIGGGEQANGIYARNKHVLPAPIMHTSHQSPMTLPYVKTLKLSNCWMTPGTFRMLFGRNSSLERLVCDSFSLTIYVEPFPAGGTADDIPAPAPCAPWRGPHRLWSWPLILDAVDPESDLTKFGDSYLHSSRANGEMPLLEPEGPTCDPEPGSEPPWSRRSRPSLEFRSCGYVGVPMSNVHGAGLDGHTPHPRDDFFVTRGSALLGVMPLTDDPNLGDIIQYLPPAELEALERVWGLREGWEDADKAMEPMFDGELAGGTGRFSGVVSKRSVAERSCDKGKGKAVVRD